MENLARQTLPHGSFVEDIAAENLGNVENFTHRGKSFLKEVHIITIICFDFMQKNRRKQGVILTQKHLSFGCDFR